MYNRRSMKPIVGTDFDFPGQTAVYHGKVRDIYTIDEKYLVAVASDRISAFDVILPRPIPYKGQVLNQLAAYFLQATADTAPNWLINTPHPNVSLGHRCEPFMVEVVVRDCMVGHAWREYRAGIRELCGVPLPEGLSEYDRLPEPIITPSTKAETGHDEDISMDKILSLGLATARQWSVIRETALELFARGQQMAEAKGLYLADTKYEFGSYGADIYVIDEVHTPDSSRYFYADNFRHNLSKEFVREWLMERGFSGQLGEAVPEMTDEFIQMVSDRYIELYEQLTGQKFTPSKSDSQAIQASVVAALEKL